MRTRSALSLVELVIVLVILGVIAAVAVPRIGRASYRARVVAAQRNLHDINAAIELYVVNRHRWPETIRPIWFRTQSLPPNPFADGELRRDLQVSSSGDRTETHPTVKTTAGPGWWYNPANGTVRARVAAQDSAAATLELYNLVNGTQVGALNQTADTGNVTAQGGGN